MFITAVAVVFVLLCAADVIHVSTGVITVVIIVGVIALIFGGISEMGKDEAARRNAREYWRKRGSGPYDQRIRRDQNYNRRNRRW